MMPTTAVLRTGDHVRLVLGRGGLIHLTSAQYQARTLYEGTLSGRTDLMPIAAPTVPQSGVWVQDCRVKQPRTVSELVKQLEELTVTVRDVQQLTAGQVSSPGAATDREVILDREAERAEEGGIFAKLTRLLSTIRILAVLAALALVLWYCWPFLLPLLKRFRVALAAKAA